MHSPLKPIDLNTDLVAQAERQTHEDIEVMIKPIHEKDQLNVHFDDDLVMFNLLPVQVNIENEGFSPCSIGISQTSLSDPSGNNFPALTSDEVYDETYKSYGRMIPWAILFGPVGALGSMINVAAVNDTIKKEYSVCMIEDGEVVPEARTAGLMFFEIDSKVESLDGWKVNMGITKDERLIDFVFDLHGDVEQPRVQKHNQSD